MKSLTPCIDDHPFKKEGSGNGGKLVKSLLADRPGMPVLGADRQA